MNIKELVPEKVESEINSPDHPTRRFVGFALLLAWHYNLWFLHDSFVGAQLLDNCVTQSWLIALVSAAVSFIVIAFALGRKHRLALTLRRRAVVRPECAVVAARRRKPRRRKRRHPSTMQIPKAKKAAKRAIDLVRLIAALLCVIALLALSVFESGRKKPGKAKAASC